MCRFYRAVKFKKTADGSIWLGAEFTAREDGGALSIVSKLRQPQVVAIADGSDEVHNFSEAEPAAAEDGKVVARIFRMLSAVIIPGYWLDFATHKNELFNAKSLAKFAPKTIYLNHGEGFFGIDVSKWIGKAVNPRLSTKPMLGIDADFRIDEEQDRVMFQGSIVRGLKFDPPAIDACSVTIHTKAEQSHPDMDRWAFYENLGREVDGKVCRFIVTEIRRVTEVSLVYAGADPYAKDKGPAESPSASAQVPRSFSEKIPGFNDNEDAEAKAKADAEAKAKAEAEAAEAEARRAEAEAKAKARADVTPWVRARMECEEVRFESRYYTAEQAKQWADGMGLCGDMSVSGDLHIMRCRNAADFEADADCHKMPMSLGIEARFRKLADGKIRSEGFSEALYWHKAEGFARQLEEDAELEGDADAAEMARKFLSDIGSSAAKRSTESKQMSTKNMVRALATVAQDLAAVVELAPEAERAALKAALEKLPLHNAVKSLRTSQGDTAVLGALNASIAALGAVDAGKAILATLESQEAGSAPVTDNPVLLYVQAQSGHSEPSAQLAWLADQVAKAAAPRAPEKTEAERRADLLKVARDKNIPPAVYSGHEKMPLAVLEVVVSSFKSLPHHEPPTESRFQPSANPPARKAVKASAEDAAKSHEELAEKFGIEVDAVVQFAKNHKGADLAIACENLARLRRKGSK